MPNALHDSAEGTRNYPEQKTQSQFPERITSRKFTENSIQRVQSLQIVTTYIDQCELITDLARSVLTVVLSREH